MPDANGNSTPKEAAAFLGVDPSTLRGYINRKELPEPGWIRVGRRKQRSFDGAWLKDAKQNIDGR